MCVREWPVGYPGLELGHFGSWSPARALRLSLTWVWTPLSFAEGWVWNLSERFWGWRREVRHCLGCLAEVGSKGRRAGWLLFKDHPSWGFVQRRKYPCSQALFKDQQPPGHWWTCTIRISPLLEVELSVVPSPPSLLPSLLSCLSSFLPL